MTLTGIFVWVSHKKCILLFYVLQIDDHYKSVHFTTAPIQQGCKIKKTQNKPFLSEDVDLLACTENMTIPASFIYYMLQLYT